jgi:hypothetical protein
MTGIEPPFRAHRREQDCRRHRRRQQSRNLPPASHWPVGYSQPATHLKTDIHIQSDSYLGKWSPLKGQWREIDFTIKTFIKYTFLFQI